ncbi:unnamed protein product [Orchesella dallaii]|uniref:Hexosyltransferase n=1 Tax=Orchesella dallaii TaxID=48710 RepID=A0ABP1R900_9HEXA
MSQCKLWNGGGNGGIVGKVAFIVPCFILAVILGFVLELFVIEKFDFTHHRLPRIIKHHFHKSLKWGGSKGTHSHFNTTKTLVSLIAPKSTTANIIQQTSSSTTETVPINIPPTKKFGWEDDSLVNLHDFKWLRNNESICKRTEEFSNTTNLIPVLVHTARSHFSERLTIRKSWGSIPPYKNWSIRLIFLLGIADRGEDPARNEKQFQEQERLLNLEQAEFGDLVTGNFLDTYKNLTYKHMMGYKWILNFCQDAKLILKIDDDMFIDIMRFIDWRSEDLKIKEKTPPDLYCNTFVGTKPQRCVGCKWYASEAEWPLDYYPDYCSGWAYGITVNMMKKLYSVIPKVDFFWVDDVYATGALMEQLKKEDKEFKLNVKHLWGQVRGLDFKNFRPMCEANDLSMKRKFGAVVPIARGSSFERDMICLWNKTLYDNSRQEDNVKLGTLGYKNKKDGLPL